MKAAKTPGIIALAAILVFAATGCDIFNGIFGSGTPTPGTGTSKTVTISGKVTN
jgi:hypothetical protein